VVWFPVNSGVRQGCVVAPDTFLVPMDWLLERTVHRGMVGTSVGKAIFTDLYFADDVALLAEMLSVLVLALEVINEEAQPLGLTINWAKTKIQTTDVTVPSGSTVQVGGSNVEVVDTFTYLGCQLHSSGGSEQEVNRRISISRNCMQMLDRHIWRSMISVSTNQGWIRTGTARNAVPVKFFTTGTAFRLRFCRFATAYRA